MSSISELFKNLKYDKMLESTKLAQEVCKTCLRNDDAKFLEFHSHSSVEEFINFIKLNTELFIQIEEIENYKPQHVTRDEINLALKFIEYHETNAIDISNKSCRSLGFIIHKRLSIFEILLNLYRNVKWNLMSLIEVSKRRFVLIDQLRNFFQLPPYKVQEQPIVSSNIFGQSFCTMIVFDSADLESATDVLSTAFNENTLPWKIRNVLVQESISKKFIESIKSKLRPFHELYLNDSEIQDATTLALGKAYSMGLNVISNNDDINVLKPSIVLGQNWNYFDDENFDSPLPTIIVMNIFRTAKESINLANSHLRGSATIWTQDISLAYELVTQLDASTFWINCHGEFDPVLPYKFGNPCEIYGSEFFRFAPFNKLEKYSSQVAYEKLQRKPYNKNFSISKIDGQFHHETFSVPEVNLFINKENKEIYKLIKVRNEQFWLHQEIFKDAFEKQQASQQVQKISNNLLLNKHKTVTFQFGVSFAN